tara:strand:- start:1080 stop:1304 length:225 start_codon:yes stop_codon:yes gene_type:complete
VVKIAIMSKEYVEYEDIARKILAQTTITPDDYRTIINMPYHQFSPEDRINFDWFLEGLEARLPDIIEKFGDFDI